MTVLLSVLKEGKREGGGGGGGGILCNEINLKLELKKESIGPLDINVGGKLREVTLKNGCKPVVFISLQYMQAIVNNIGSYFFKKEKRFHLVPKIPLGTSCRPEIDISFEL